MYSSQDNLKNPLVKNWLALDLAVETWKTPTVHHISQDEYNLMGTHDPNHIYHIIGNRYPTVYIGDQRVPNVETSCQYMLGPCDQNGIYHLYIVLQNHGNTTICEIMEFDNVTQAIKILNRWNSVGHTGELGTVIKEAIITYTKGHTNIHEFLTGLISMFGYRDDPRLQDVNQVMMTFGSVNFDRNLPNFAMEQLSYIRYNSTNILFLKYFNLYDWVVTTNFFADIRSDDYLIPNVDTFDFVPWINKVCEIMHD